MTSRNFRSINTVTRSRELILQNLGELFRTRGDFQFLGNTSKESRLFLFDEESNHESAADAYPRITLHRNGSQYHHLGGLNDVYIGDNFFQNKYSRADLVNHDFSLRVKALDFHQCEDLAFITSFFLRFFERELTFDPARNQKAFEATHEGFSRVVKAGESTEQESVWQCDIGFVLQVNEVAEFFEQENSKLFENLNVEIVSPETTCQ